MFDWKPPAYHGHQLSVLRFEDINPECPALFVSLSCINLVFLSTNNFQSAEKRDNILEIFHTFYIKLEHIKEYICSIFHPILEIKNTTKNPIDKIKFLPCLSIVRSDGGIVDV